MSESFRFLVALSLGCMVGCLGGLYHPTLHSKDPLPADIPCEKCGSRAIKLRCCFNACSTFHMSVAEDGSLKVVGPLMWGYEHLHRTCATCTWDGTAMDCRPLQKD